jgi:predicted transcriptional regulator
MNLEKYGFVMAGKLRQKIVSLLVEPKTPTQLKDIVKTQDSTLSRCLKQLREKEIINLVNKDARKGRIYELTKDGQDIASKLK